MAQYLCDATGHRYREPQQTMYPAILSAADAQRRKLRLCPDHFVMFTEHLVAHAQLVSDQDANNIIRTCALCDQEVDGPSASFFVTVYAAKRERADWYGTVHEACVDALAEDWLLPPRMP